MRVDETTARAPTGDELARFREQIADRFGIFELGAASAHPFRAAISATPLSEVADVAVVKVRADPLLVERTRRDIARADRDAFTIGILTEGSGTLIQGGREARLGPGDLVLCDGRRPFQLTFDSPFEQLLLHVDAARVLARIPHVERMTATKLDGGRGVGSVTGALLRSIGKEAPALGVEAAAIAEHALDLVALAFSGTLPQAGAERLLIARVKATIEGQLPDPELSPDRVAAAHRLSRRTLYRLFEAEQESVHAFILRRRLERCHSALADPAQAHRSVTEIAFAWGFNAASHFSRAFRQAYGLGPRAWRRRAAG